jgi:hypothetical protein
MAGIARKDLDHIGNLSVDLRIRYEGNHPVENFDKALERAVEMWTASWNGSHPNPYVGHRTELTARLWYQVVAEQLRFKNLLVTVQPRRHKNEPWSSILLDEARKRRPAWLGREFY